MVKIATFAKPENVEQNRYAVAPVSASGIRPAAKNESLSILISCALVGVLVISSPKFSTYDTIEKAHVGIHAIEALGNVSKSVSGQGLHRVVKE